MDDEAITQKLLKIRANKGINDQLVHWISAEVKLKRCCCTRHNPKPYYSVHYIVKMTKETHRGGNLTGLQNTLWYAYPQRHPSYC